jgi:hypothetical protein
VEPFDQMCDVYSFGVVLWQLVTLKEPYEDIDSFVELRRRVCQEVCVPACSGSSLSLFLVLMVAVQHERPAISVGVAPRLAALMLRCWDTKPTNRPTFATILPELQAICVDVSVKDEAGNRYWTKYFVGQERVDWRTFSTALCAYLAIAPSPATSLALRCLRHTAGEISEARANKPHCPRCSSKRVSAKS